MNLLQEGYNFYSGNYPERWVSPVTQFRPFTPERITFNGVPVELSAEQHYFSCVVPYRHLTGIQRPHEYTGVSLRRVRRKFQEFGESYLYQEPSLACAIIGDRGTVGLYIFEGHTRVRYAPRNFRQAGVPTIIMPLQVASEVYKQHSVTAPPEDFRSFLLYASYEAIWSFQDSYMSKPKEYAPPEPIVGAEAQYIIHHVYGPQIGNM